MCGLVGIAGDIGSKEDKAFHMLLLMDQVRGKDSTGVVVVSKHTNSVEIYKEIGPPTELFNNSVGFNDKGIVKCLSSVLMGHNRYATTGGVNRENAHPFKFGHVYGSHNGTLRNYSGLKGTFDVDSKAMFSSISDMGIEHTWKNFTGAAALTWWDDKTKEINFIRNSERPLFLATFNKGKSLIWASEGWMIHAALSYVNLRVDDGGDSKVGNPWKLAVDHLHTYEVLKGNIRMTRGLKLTPMATPSYYLYNMDGNYYNYTSHNKTFNSGWRSKKNNAKRKFRNLKFSLISSKSSLNTLGKMVYTLDGLTDINELVSIYPSSYEEWREVSDILKGPLNNTLECKMISRPLVTSDEGGLVFHNDSAGVSITYPELDTKYFKGLYGHLVDREEFRIQLKEFGSSCSYCDIVVTTEDEPEFVNNGGALCCRECSGDPGIMYNTYGGY